MNRILIILSVVFAGALLAPLVCRAVNKKYVPWLLSVFPLFAFSALLYLAPNVFAGERLIEKYEWVNALHFDFQFDLDGLSLLFGLLITGIGTLVVIYGGVYLSEDRSIRGFYSYLFIFMGAMLGMILSDNIFVLFIFWELTSISSYLLIGYHYEEQSARKSARQALLVTGAGGLVLIAGMILASNAAGSPNISDWIAGSNNLLYSEHFKMILLLLLIGAFTKSAQFPFHFWLPNAMVAPTPVSAYLHSATMVKAGVYLLARLNPCFYQAEEWRYALILAGGITMLLGAVWSLFQTDLKKILAYTTISALGVMVFGIGVGTPDAIRGVVVFLLAHALYKGALFMVAGNIDHATGSRNITKLGALSAKMPFTGIGALLAALSMAGFPFMLGFLSKELLYEAAYHSELKLIFIIPVFLTGVLFASQAILIGWKLFYSKSGNPLSRLAHEVPAGMYIGPLALGACGLIAGVLPGMSVERLLAKAVDAVSIAATGTQLKLWHGLTPVLGLSALTLLTGWILYRSGNLILKKSAGIVRVIEGYGPERVYDKSWELYFLFAEKLTAIVQNGYLRYYIMTILVSLISLLLLTVLHYNLSGFNVVLAGIEIYEILLALLVAVALGFVVTARSRLIAVIILGVIGYGIAIFYAIYGGADLAMTQFLVETLVVVVFVYILSRLPGFARLSSRLQRYRDVVIAAAGGTAITAVILLLTNIPLDSELKRYFGASASLIGKGHNVVNVILVDFRALDTLGEITVLAIAGMGVFALMKLKSKRI